MTVVVERTGERRAMSATERRLGCLDGKEMQIRCFQASPWQSKRRVPERYLAFFGRLAIV